MPWVCAQVGAHYYTGAVTSDPWTSVAYTSADGTASGTLSVTTGATAAEVAGRAFIVHGYDGGRIACALLGEGATLSAAGFVLYPGSTSTLAVAGTVSQMVTVGTTQTFDYSFTGLDTDCASGAGSGIGNSCGIHIHSGFSCSDAALVSRCSHPLCPRLVPSPCARTPRAFVARSRSQCHAVRVCAGGRPLLQLGLGPV